MVISCDRHGIQATVHACQHIVSAVYDRKSLEDVEYEEFIIEYKGFLDGKKSEKYAYFCKECVKKYQLPSSKVIQQSRLKEVCFSEAFDDAGVVCIACWEELNQ